MDNLPTKPSEIPRIKPMPPEDIALLAFIARVRAALPRFYVPASEVFTQKTNQQAPPSPKPYPISK